jgi:hypothetical protein
VGDTHDDIVSVVVWANAGDAAAMPHTTSAARSTILDLDMELSLKVGAPQHKDPQTPFGPVVYTGSE